MLKYREEHFPLMSFCSIYFFEKKELKLLKKMRGKKMNTKQSTTDVVDKSESF